MPRTAEQNKVIKEKRKNRLLNVSLKMFATKGYTLVTTDNISKGARISHGLFYHYFSSKDDAYQATVRHFVLGSSSPFLSEADMKSLHGVEGLKKFFEIADFVQTGDIANLYMAKIVLDIERGLSKGQVTKEVKDRFNFPVIFERLISEGQKDGDVIAGNPKEITAAFFNLFTGLIDGLLASDDKAKKPISKDTLLAMTLKKPL